MIFSLGVPVPLRRKKEKCLIEYSFHLLSIGCPRGGSGLVSALKKFKINFFLIILDRLT